MDSSTKKDRKNNIKFGLFSRMLTALFILLVSTLAILSVSLLKNAANHFDDFRLQHAQSMARTLGEGSLDALITEDYEILERFVKSSLPPHYGAYAYLTRPNGQILSSTNLDLVATKIIPPKIISNDISRSLNYKDRPIIEVVFKANIGKKHLANAHVAYYTDQGNFSYFGQAKEIIFALIILLIVILAGTYFIVSRIRTPVLNLINTVINTSLDTPIHLPQKMYWRNDEVGALAKSFDDVFTRLTSANEKIIDARNNLALKVQQRTQQLSDKNNEIEVAQQRLNAIMDNAGDSIISINDKGLIGSFNIAAQSLFGYTLEEVQGKNVNILMPEPYHSAHDNYLKRYLETGTPHVIGKAAREVTGKRKDNSEFPMELLINHINLHGENLFIGIVRDITLQKEAQELLQRSNELLEKNVKERTIELKESNDELIIARDAALDASKLKSEFLSTISHELRTPLHAISGYENLLSSTKLDKKQTKYCNLINQSAHDLLDIINEVLDFSAIESGGIKIDRNQLYIKDTLDEISEMFSFAAEQKGLQFSYHIDEDVPSAIYTDCKRLKQTIVNLISNAIKFTKHGSITINVNKSDKTDSKELIQFSVADTGIGIDKSELERVFNLFYQVDGSVSRSYGGTGLGLATSKKIIELMGGEILIQSQLKQGSTFTISLPLVTEETSKKKTEDITLHEGDELSTAEIIVPKSDVKIIIVEDNEINAELLLIQLDHLGYSADVAENGKIFIEMMDKNHYDLVLMDCQMPVMNGYEATTQYRSTEKPDSHVPIIAVTANALDTDREKCLASGMDDYIVKPVNSATLNNALNQWAAHH